jgi:aryl-alcohol dehydrogenase-like predicted oxidoreductase
MEYRRLGRSGLDLSVISYGNWLTHGDGVDNATAVACAGKALDAGITVFDTADMYADGRAEELLGSALAGIRRESVIVCSKVGLPTSAAPGDRGLSRTRVITNCHASLRRLRTDYIDLYQAHRFDEETPLEETIATFSELVHAGDVRYVGVSEWTSAQLREGQRLALQAGIQLVSNQPQYSVLWRVPEAEVMPTSAELGISQIAYSPLAQGVLTGKYPPGRMPPTGSRADQKSTNSSIRRYLSGELRLRVGDLRPIAQEADLSLAQLALAWVLHNQHVTSAIIGASRPEQISENIKAVEARLDEDIMNSIDGVLGDIIERDPTKAGRPYDVMKRWCASETA